MVSPLRPKLSSSEAALALRPEWHPSTGSQWRRSTYAQYEEVHLMMALRHPLVSQYGYELRARSYALVQLELMTAVGVGAPASHRIDVACRPDVGSCYLRRRRRH